VLVPVQITSPFYIWTTPAWLAWYLYATRKNLEPAVDSGPRTVTADDGRAC
jgi:hypothetical protein